MLDGKKGCLKCVMHLRHPFCILSPALKNLQYLKSYPIDRFFGPCDDLVLLGGESYRDKGVLGVLG